MLIIITTQREILAEEYYLWAQAAKKAGCQFDPKELLEKGEVSYSTDLGYTKATTTMRLVR